MDAYVSLKKKKSTQDTHIVYFNVQKQFSGPDHMVRHAAEAEKKLQNSHYDSEKKG